MSNNAKISSVAVNCKKVLKSLKVRIAVISACALGIAAAAATAAFADQEIKLTALPVIPADASAAKITAMPPKEYDVKISVDGKNIGVKCSGTVADALNAADVEVYDDDLINIGFNEPLGKGTEIVINRVDIIEEVQIEVIEYATRYREDDGYMVGYTETVVDGEEGEVETTLRHVYIDGKLISSDVIDEDVTEPVDEVIVVGTKEEVYAEPLTAAPGTVQLDENGIPLNYTKVLTGSATAYTAPAGAITSIGETVAEGIVAVDPDIIPYGTEMYIVSVDGTKVYGYGVAADTGGALRNGTALVDVFMTTLEGCYGWGRCDVNVYILG